MYEYEIHIQDSQGSYLNWSNGFPTAASAFAALLRTAEEHPTRYFRIARVFKIETYAAEGYRHGFIPPSIDVFLDYHTDVPRAQTVTLFEEEFYE